MNTSTKCSWAEHYFLGAEHMYVSSRMLANQCGGYDYDSTAIRLHFDDATTYHSTILVAERYP